MFACASSVLAQQRHGDALDDVLAHVPMATVVAMKLGGVESRHDWTQLAVTAGASYLLSAGVALGLKRGINEWRPDHSDQRSFPSGHTTMAFSGATVLHMSTDTCRPGLVWQVTEWQLLWPLTGWQETVITGMMWQQAQPLVLVARSCAIGRAVGCSRTVM